MKPCTKLCQIVRVFSMKSVTFPKRSFVIFHLLARLDNPRSFHLSSSLFTAYTIAIFHLVAVYDLRYILLFQPTFDLSLVYSNFVELANSWTFPIVSRVSHCGQCYIAMILIVRSSVSRWFQARIVDNSRVVRERCFQMLG
jgi:hypothetical protein